MAEAAVQFLFQNIASTLQTLKEDEGQLQSLISLLESVKDEDQRIRGFSRIGIDLRHRLEDAIQDLRLKAESGVLTRLRNIHNLNQTDKEIDQIRSRVKHLLGISRALGISADQDRSSSLLPSNGGYQIITEQAPQQLVGRDDDIKYLRSVILATDSPCRVVVICGMGGLGKTSLAKKLCRDLEHHFQKAALVHVPHSQKPHHRRILEDLHEQLYPAQTDFRVHQFWKDELTLRVRQIQCDCSCLVVLDGMYWSRDALDVIRLAFPIEHHTPSKLLITTRETQVAEAVFALGLGLGAGKIHVHRLWPLKEDDGSQLFQSKLQPHAATEIHKMGKKVSHKMGKKVSKFCGGVPLAIINFSESKQSREEWKTVHRNLEFYVRKSREIDTKDSILQSLSLSYDYLPDHLKSCFLYLGNFGKDRSIDAEKLCLFWLAEGLVSLEEASRRGETLKDTAVRYLNDLAGRSMVEVHEDEIPTFIGIKSCQLNPTMQDLALLKSKEQGFFQVVDFVHKREHKPDYQPYRLAINLDEYEDGCSFPVSHKDMKHIRSLLFSTTKNLQENSWPREVSTLVHFKYLRILDFNGFDFRVINLPQKIEALVHLRCLSFKGSVLPNLPIWVGKLRSLLVLDLRVRSQCQTIIPDVICKLKKLIHVFFPKSFCTNDGLKLRLKGLTELESIINFNSGALNFEDLFLLPKLRYVASRIHGNIADDDNDVKCIHRGMDKMLEDRSFNVSLNIRNFDCYTEDRHSLFRHILGWKYLVKFCIEGHISRLPDHRKMSKKLAKIVLIGSELVEDPMEVLGQLKTLVKLVLDDDAFVGKGMTCLAGCFKELKHLELLGLQNLEKWIMEDGAMPKLSTLALRDCRKLKMQEHELRFVCHSSLLKVEVSGMHTEFDHNIKKVGGDKIKCKPPRQ